jgi:hypothetical protein
MQVVVVNAAARAGYPWLPPSGSVWHVPCGEHWDVVRAPRNIGLAAIELLGEDCGAVICDPWSRVLFFLAEAGCSTGWRLPPTFAGGAATYLPVPPIDAEESRLHWHRPPTPEHVITQTRQLRDALERAVACLLGPRKEAS